MDNVVVQLSAEEAELLQKAVSLLQEGSIRLTGTRNERFRPLEEELALSSHLGLSLLLDDTIFELVMDALALGNDTWYWIDTTRESSGPFMRLYQRIGARAAGYEDNQLGWMDEETLQGI